MFFQKPLLICLGGLLLLGCQTTKLYPVCQYNGKATPVEINDFRESAEVVFDQVTGNSHQDQDLMFLPGDRYVSARAFGRQHDEFSESWETIACVGSYSNERQQAKYSSCRKFINQTLISNNVGASEKEILRYTEDEDSCGLHTEFGDCDALLYCNGT